MGGAWPCPCPLRDEEGAEEAEDVFRATFWLTWSVYEERRTGAGCRVVVEE